MADEDETEDPQGGDAAAGTQPGGEQSAQESGGAGPQEAPQKTVGAALGEIAWLLSQSGAHRHSLFLGDLEWLVMPPLARGQYRLFYAEGKPIGVALWGFVSETVEQRLSAGGRLGAHEWRSGDRVWLVELVAPFGQQEAMLEDLRSTALADRRFRFLRTNAQGRRETVTLDGTGVEGAA